MVDFGLRNPKRILAYERQRKALELRKAGATFQQIAEQLGYKNMSGAYRAIEAALLKTLQEPADDVRKMELERLDKMMLGLWTGATSGHVPAVHGVLAIMERRAKYLGLDAPTKIDISHYIRQIALDAGLDPEEALEEAARIVKSAHAYR